ncbi:transposase [Rhodosalinus sp.]|uniref:transposase n=1 Tax=Rhodosalinus sp. TaxID=2047741 RepID=UPI00397D9B9F
MQQRLDSLPIDVHGHQPKAEWNGFYRSRIYHPLVTSVAETGDMLDARLRPGAVAHVKREDRPRASHRRVPISFGDFAR